MVLKDEKRKLAEIIQDLPFVKTGGEAKVDEEIILSNLIVDYLLYHGYCDTAEVFAASSHSASDKSIGEIGQQLSEARNRSIIRQLILSGDIDQAMEMINCLYPDLLKDSNGLILQLRCRKFVEMISRGCLKDMAAAVSDDEVMRDVGDEENGVDAAFQLAFE